MVIWLHIVFSNMWGPQDLKCLKPRAISIVSICSIAQIWCPDFSCFKYFKNCVAPRLGLIEIILPAFKYVNVSTISSSIYLKEDRPGGKYTLKEPL